MSDVTSVRGLSAQRRRSAPPVWWLVFKREFVDLWTGGRVLVLLILFALVMSVTSVLRQLESELDLIPAKEMVFLTLLSAISFGLFIGLVIGADSISGERERATLEPLLLAPARRRQIVFGKFLAAMSPWPVTLLLAFPYMYVLSQGDDSLLSAVQLGLLVGGLLAVAFTGFGMIVSIWATSNKLSLFVCLTIYLVLLIPTQFPGNAQKGDLGYLVQELNPLQASSEFLEKVLVNNRTVAEKMPYLMAAILAAFLVLGTLFLFAAPRVRLEGQSPRLPRPRWGRATPLLAVVGAAGLLALLPTTTARAATTATSTEPFAITIDMEYATVAAGTHIDFTTVVTNQGSSDSAPLNVAMNIVKTGKGEPVDPEDWSPERTQPVAPLSPGESKEQSWIVDAILEGDYIVYMAVIPQPTGPETTTLPVASPGIHLTVTAFTDTNPGGVLPVAIITPVALILLALLPRRRWRRKSGNDDSAVGP